MDAKLLIVDADLGLGRPQQIRIDAGSRGARILEVGERVESSGARRIDARGGAVLPGFTDHHLHLHALAVAESSIRCGPPAIRDVRDLESTIRSAPNDDAGWVRGIGYTESVAGDLTRERLDLMEHRRPVRIQHRSGALWMLNSAALLRVGAAGTDHPGIERDAEGQPTGRLWRADDWLRSRSGGPGPPSLRSVGRRLRELGIVELTDATPDLDDAATANIVSAVNDSSLHGRVLLLGVPLGRQIDHPRISVGPFKIVVADSSLPSPDDLAEQIVTAHQSGRAVAIHCVSRVAFAILMAAWETAGVRAGDRIEHAGVVAETACAQLAAMDVHVVTQPGFLTDRGDDFLEDSDTADHPDLYRCGSLIRAGVPVGLSSDAPYGPIDPWVTINAAVNRRTASGRRVGDEGEAISTEDALERHQSSVHAPGGPPRRIRIGASGDLIIVDRPLNDVLASPEGVRVIRTVIGGLSDQLD